MLMVLAVLFTAMWMLGLLSRNTWGGKVHLVLALAIVAFILHFLQRRIRPAAGSASSNPADQRRESTLLNRRK